MLKLRGYSLQNEGKTQNHAKVYFENILFRLNSIELSYFVCPTNKLNPEGSQKIYSFRSLWYIPLLLFSKFQSSPIPIKNKNLYVNKQLFEDHSKRDPYNFSGESWIDDSLVAPYFILLLKIFRYVFLNSFRSKGIQPVISIIYFHGIFWKFWIIVSSWYDHIWSLKIYICIQKYPKTQIDS